MYMEFNITIEYTFETSLHIFLLYKNSALLYSSMLI